MSLPPPALLADLFKHLPFLVFHTTTDGTVLHSNPEASKVTGYEAGELAGRNLWGILFPGKLFAQVPKFISLLEPSPLKDVPMTVRTKAGRERVIAFSRYVHVQAAASTDTSPRTFICVGVDLTDRLLDAEREKLPPSFLTESELGDLTSFGPHIGNGGAIDGEFVTPIAISPRSPKPLEQTPQEPTPLQQVRDSLARVETHMHCVQASFAEGEMHALGTLRTMTRTKITAHESFAFIARGEWMHTQISGNTMGCIRARVDELLTLYRPEMA